MAIIASAGSGTTFVPAPQGVHRAVCVDVVDMGLLEVTWNNQKKQQHKIRVVWQIDEAMDDGKPFIVQKRYTLSLHEKAQLRKDLESWRGKAFSDDEQKGFDVERLVGVSCMLNVMHVSRDGKTYANVTAVMPLHKGMSKLEPSADYVRVQDRPTDQPAGQAHTEPDYGRDDRDGDPFGDVPPITDDDIPF